MMKHPPKGKFAGTVRVGDKGQIVIPKQAREMLGIEPGDTLLLLADVKRGIGIQPTELVTRLTEMIVGQMPGAEGEDDK